MHKIIFKELEFRNFMSYGNTLNKFEFRDGLTWLHGDNGFGKSAIVEAMTFALLGISYRGGKKEELRNTKNAATGSPTSVVLTFDTVDPPEDPESYRITRTISGKKSTTKFVIEKMIDGVWIEQNTRAGLSQQDFEEKVLQFNEVLFKNVIAMNTQETLPFFMLPAAKKRELLESIISMSLDAWKKANNKRLSESNISFSIAESDIQQLSSEISELELIYQQMKEERSTNLEQMKVDLQTYTDQSTELNRKYNERTAKKQEVSDELSAIRAELLTESKVDNRIAEIKETFSGVEQLATAKRSVDEAKAAYEKLESDNAESIAEYKQAKSDMAHYREMINEEDQNKRSLERQLAKKETEFNLMVAKRDGYTKIAESFVVGTPCPTCGHISDESDVERHKNALREQWKEANKSVKELNAELTKLNNAIEESQKLLDEYEQKEANAFGDVTTFEETIEPVQTEAYAAITVATNNYNKLLKMTKDFDTDTAKAELVELEAKKKTYPALREQYTEKNTEWSEISQSLSDINGTLVHVYNEIDRLKAEIEKAENNTDDAIAVMEAKINKNRGMLKDAYDRLHKASDTIAICNLITQVCADNGMKKMVFSMFVPAFNKAVQRNITKANLPFVVTFNDAMDYEFQTLPGLSPSYTMLSQGQKRKLGFAISMAFRDFVSLVGNFNVNFLSLDEVLDISTDDHSMRDMLDLAKLMLADIGCAVIITHRGKVVADKFDFQQEVMNNGMYSRLGDLKPMWEKDKVA